MNFRWVAHLDTLGIMPQLFKTAPAKWEPVTARGEGKGPMYGLGASLLLRAHHPITEENWLHDLQVRETRAIEQWTNMKRLLERARRAVMAEHEQMIATGSLRKVELTGEMGRAMISRLDAGSTIFWHTDNGPYHDRTVRFHLPLVTNPGCVMYSGPQMQHMEVGALWYFNNKCRHSAANWGQSMRLHLIFEMYRQIHNDVVDEN